MAAVVLALIIGVGIVNVAAPASALSPGVSFAAEDQPSWQTNGTIYALGAAGGKVVAGGTFSQIRPPAGRSDAARARNALVILDAETGEPDACQFAVTLSGGTPTIRAITTSADGSRVYVAGNFSSVGGVNVARIAALDVQACTVTPFRAPLPSSTVTALALHGSTLYAGGLFQTVGGNPRQAFAAFRADSGALLPWTANAVRGRTDLPPQVNEARAVAVSPDGAKVVLGGDMFSINGQYSHSIAIVSGASPLDGSGGEVLRTYPQGFIPDTSVTKTIIDGGDGNFYIGNEGTGGGVFDGKAAFSWSTGDQVWRDTCLGATQSLVMYQGTLYSASHAHDCSGINAFNDGIRRYFMAQNPQTTEILGWLPLGNDGIGEGIGPRALVVATGRTTGQNYLWSGGDFTSINGRAQQGLTRFGPQDTGNPPTPVASAQAMADGTVQVRFRTVVDADDSHLLYSVYRGNAAEPIWTGTGRSLWWERPQVTFVDTAVSPGATYSYRVTASDGTNTSARSSAVTATARAATSDYSAAVRADGPQSLWSGAALGSWVQDSAAQQSRTDAVPAALMDGATTSADSAVPSGGGSLQFDGANDYAITDQLRAGPSTYTVETWINTTTTAGGKIVGFGNGRPRTGSGVSNLSGNYDRHVYMRNDGRVTFGVWVGHAATLTSPQALNDGQWHHIVATQGPSGMTLSIDGLRVGTNGTSNAQGYYGVWRVGGDNLSGWPDRPASDFFAGLIDETAIYSSALPATRIADHYLASGRTLDVNAAPADAYGAAVFAGDPSLYWRFDDSADSAADASMFGTSTGAYNTGASRSPNGAVAGSGSLTLPGNESGTVGLAQPTAPSSAFTGEVWFRTDTTDGGKIFGFENTLTGNGGNYDKHLYMTNDGKLVWGSWIGSAAIVQSPLSYNDGAWHQAVGVIDTSGRKLYVDGQLVASSNVPGAETGSGRWRVGGGNIGGWPGQPNSFYFRGDLDEFAIYSSTLDAATIARHFAIGVADTTPPSAPGAASASLQADGVHLSWAPATDNRSVASYTVYRGATADFAPGEDTRLGTTTTTSFVDSAQFSGSRYYRVVAVDAASNVGPATAAVAVERPDVTAPSAPTSPVAMLGADGIALSWTASSDDVGVTSYRVHRGATSDFAVTADNAVGTSATPSFSDPVGAPGTYFYRIVALDAAANASEASAAVSATIAAPDTAAPSAPGAPAATLSGSTARVSWTAATDDTGVTGYLVHRGSDAAFEPNGANRVAQVTGLGYDDTGLTPGVYHYKIRAVDAAGNIGAAASVSVTVESAAEPVTVRVPVADDAMLSQAAPTTNYGSLNQISSRAGASSVESLLSLPLPTAPAGTALTRATLSVRTSTDPTAGTLDATDFAVIPDTWNESTVTWSTRPTTSGTPLGRLGQAPATNTAYAVDLSATALQARLGSTATIRMTGAGADNLRLWSSEAATASYRPVLALEFTPLSASDTTAPTAPTGVQASASGATVGLGWTAATDDRGVVRYEIHRSATPGFAVSAATRVGESTATSATDGPLAPGTYLYRVVAFDAAGNAGPASTEAMVTIAAPDTTAPTVPGTPAIALSGTSTQVSWAPSSDASGAVTYDVYRGASAGFTADAASRIGSPTGTSFTDGPLAPGTYWYRVSARDSSGNSSAASAASSVTVAAPTQTATATVTVDADAAAYSSMPAQNYGTANQLVSRGDVGQQSFLRLTLPTLPPGATLVSAAFSVRTSTDPTAGSAGTHDLHLVTGAWEESTLTWANRPTATVGSTALGMLTGATATNTAYTAALAVDQLTPLLGQTVTLRLSTTSADNLRILSREATTPAQRPTLTLTYSVS
ncbi:DNRLRE domain-containing protein [Microbacterium radiodurans]|uniref:DNRLRE domain-containing protein n=1 Tax=Microbacterium radiodurans TaxID=661398 RepID=A0A5J5IPJ1_9MICO|nr:DNRLRE domain-containing protein [Microbacterium radiodurans]